MIAIAPFINNKSKVYCALILLPLLVYMKSFWFDFSPMDEEWMINRNQGFLKEWGNIIASFKQPTGDIYYRPLLLISFIVDYHISAISPWMFHITNVVLHITCVLLVFKV